MDLTPAKQVSEIINSAFRSLCPYRHCVEQGEQNALEFLIRVLNRERLICSANLGSECAGLT